MDRIIDLLIWGLRLSSILFTIAILSEIKRNHKIVMGMKYWIGYCITLVSWFV